MWEPSAKMHPKIHYRDTPEHNRSENFRFQSIEDPIKIIEDNHVSSD